MSFLEPLPPMRAVRAGDQVLQVRQLGAGPRLILLHGGPGLDHHLLLPLGRRLAADFEVWLPDLPGHGRSRRRGDPAPDLARLREELVDWIRALEPAPALLAGHSLGARLVLELVDRRGIRPGAAVLLSPPAEGRAPHPARLSLRATRGNRGRVRDDLARLCAEEDEPLAPEFRAELGRCRVRPPWEYPALVRQLDQALARPVRRRRLSCPALLLVGSRDRITPPAEVERLHRALPGSQLRTLEGEGHFPFATGPSRTAAAILRFAAACGLLRPAGAP